jgi:serine/threonine protein kinase
VKKLKIDEQSQEFEQNRLEFIREAKLLTSIRPHPNLVQMMGYSIDPLFMVMEYLANGTLLSALKRKSLDNADKIRICHEIALGMVHLHAEGIIHRDLAARNILLDKSMMAKVSDFGLSRSIGDQESGQTKTEILSIQWNAPEAVSDRLYSKKSDVWSFGVLVWEVVADGQMPYTEYKTSPALVIALCQKKASLKVPKEAPDVLRKVVKTCMQYDPRKRPSFEQIVEILTNEHE